jgi:hypothetical protein
VVVLEVEHKLSSLLLEQDLALSQKLQLGLQVVLRMAQVLVIPTAFNNLQWTYGINLGDGM